VSSDSSLSSPSTLLASGESRSSPSLSDAGLNPLRRPFWISPRQVIVIPVAAAHKEYAEKVKQKLWDAGLFVDVDSSNNTLPKKIRNGEIAQYNFILGSAPSLLLK
jgi:threonyl-tRNA synthetase